MNFGSKSRFDLSEKQRELLARLTGSGPASAPIDWRVARSQNREPAPLSQAQQRLWFLNQLEPESTAYNENFCLQMNGRLDTEALQKAFNGVVSRHEALRTVFRNDGGIVSQRVLPSLQIPIRIEDLSSVPSSNRWSMAGEIARNESRHIFDLTRGPLLRVRLLRLSDEEHLLVLVMHHIVTDGWSYGVLIREFAGLYSGAAGCLPELPIQYSDYARAQRRWLEDGRLAGQIDYWKKTLAGASQSDLPRAGYAGGPEESGGRFKFKIEPKLRSQIDQLAARAEVTRFMALLAALKALLYRYSGYQDVSVGTPVAGRTAPETHGLIGVFVNTLVLRAEILPQYTFQDLLHSIKRCAVGAFANQDLPFEKLVEEIRPERVLNSSPLFQVFLVYEDLPSFDLKLPGLRVEMREVENDEEKFDLMLSITETPEGLRGAFSCKKGVFNDRALERLSGHFLNLLDAAVSLPSVRIDSVELMSQSERRQIVEEWNRKESRWEENGRCLHDLILEQADKTPDAIAVRCGCMAMSYLQLRRSAEIIAGELTKCGVGPECLVGICMTRSIDLPAVLLGCLCSGGAYVPLDPAYPKDRLAAIMADSKPVALICERRLAPILPEVNCPTIWLEEAGFDSVNAGSSPDFGAGPSVVAENPAYIIYTSGSTGNPKGVMIEHRNPAGLLHWAKNTYGSELTSAVLGSTSICFDLSVFELFATLYCGGTVVLVENILELVGLPGREHLTLINTVPSSMAVLVRMGQLPQSVKTINLAGEPLKKDLVDQLYESGVNEVYDLYGPSEDTTYSTGAVREKGGAETIGRPLFNKYAFIVDPGMMLVPVGVWGELQIGGSGLGRGYLKHPELTSEKFVPDWITGRPGQRLYRTGDLGRWREDGTIEYLGRMDQQVKVRGYRVEPGEIESVLKSQEGIRDAVVVARGQGENRRLVGYVAAENGADTESLAERTRNSLARKLPEYMVPSVIVLIEEFPLMPNGKLDREALPDPERLGATANAVGPRNPEEQILCAICADVLKRDRVDVHENLFAMGVHSLLAVQVVARISDSLGVDLPVRALFERPTVAALAEQIREETGDLDEPPPLERIPREGDLELHEATLPLNG